MNDSSTAKKAIGGRIREERLRLKLSQEELGSFGGVIQNTQWKYEDGQRTPDAMYLALVAEKGVDVLYVVTGRREPPPDIYKEKGSRMNESRVGYDLGAVNWQDAKWLALGRALTETNRVRLQDIGEALVLGQEAMKTAYGVRKVVLGVMCWLVMSAASAAWKVEAWTDSMTDEVKKAATVTNAKGHSLVIYRQANGSVWAIFFLADRSADAFSPATPPIYRVDKNEPYDLAGDKQLTENKALGLVLYLWKPKAVTFVVWHGKESEGMNEKNALYQMMHGESIVFRYYLFPNGSNETSFTLDGAEKAITAVLGLNRVRQGAKR